MRVFRLSRAVYAEKLDGKGAEKYGGRWNQLGIPMVYTSGTRALALLEILAGLPPTKLPGDLVLAEIEVPDQEVESLHIKSLPDNWDLYPATGATIKFGSEWADQKRSLLLEVPSSLISEEKNYLINPVHPLIDEAAIVATRSFRIDRRLSG